MSYVDVVFDGPPGPDPGRFVEVEDATGRSIRFGEWVERADGYWVLRLPLCDPNEVVYVDPLEMRAFELGVSDHDPRAPRLVAPERPVVDEGAGPTLAAVYATLRSTSLTPHEKVADAIDTVEGYVTVTLAAPEEGQKG